MKCTSLSVILSNLHYYYFINYDNQRTMQYQQKLYSFYISLIATQ
jgi:hypothetical protein